MRTIPILFTGEMVRAILDGRKTQTRRVVKPQPHKLISDFHELGRHGWKPAWAMREFSGKIGGEDHGAAQAEWEAVSFGDENRTRHCPYGQPGDHLWVRETWALRLATESYSSLLPGIPFFQPRRDRYQQALYRADRLANDADHRWRPSIHMPRWASRLTLGVTGVRVERVQEISHSDAIAEGCAGSDWHDHPSLGPCTDAGVLPDEEFAELWDSINAKRGYSWESNPWVWIVDFEKVTP